jgi:hypothetical protein
MRTPNRPMVVVRRRTLYSGGFTVRQCVWLSVSRFANKTITDKCLSLVADIRDRR